MSKFVEAIDAEIVKIERRQVDVKGQIEALTAEAEQIETLREKLLDMRAAWNGDGVIEKADEPVEAAPKPKRGRKPGKSKGIVEREESIIGYLRGHGPSSGPQILAAIGGSGAAVKKTLQSMVASGRVERTGETRSTRYRVPAGGLQKAERTVVVSSKPEAKIASVIPAQRKRQVLDALRGGAKTHFQLREATGIGQGGLVQALISLGDAVEKAGDFYRLSTPRPPADGKPVPVPPPARTPLQDRIVGLVGVMPLGTTALATELGANVLKVENACSALKKRGEVEFADGVWSLA